MTIARSAPFKAALFDLDGVVVFSDVFHYRAWKQLADEQGWEFDEAVNEGCKGVPRMASLDVILRHNGVSLAENEKAGLAARKNASYVASLEEIDNSSLVPGVREWIETLQQSAVPLGLCSSSKNASLILDKLDLTGFFKTVVTGHDIEHPKPHPEIFLQGACGCGVLPEDAVVFEDAASGIAAALAAGCRSVGGGRPEDLPGADLCIRDFHDAALGEIKKWFLLLQI